LSHKSEQSASLAVTTCESNVVLVEYAFHVGVNLAVAGLDKVEAAEFGAKSGGSGAILSETVHVMVKGVQSHGGDHTRLTYPTTASFLSSLGKPYKFRISHHHTPHRCFQSLGKPTDKGV
jgi:hypothetical protein